MDTLQEQMKRFRKPDYYSNSANFPDHTKMWFYIPYSKWFLATDEKQPMQGAESWFDSVLKVAQKVTKPLKKKRINIKEIKLELTKDPELLQQYYNLREKSYREKLGFARYNGQENEYDKTGDILLVIVDGKVKAGARIDFSDNNKSMYNDDMDSGFSYKEVIKSFDPDFKEGDVYCEICGLAVMDDVEDGFFTKFFSSILVYTINKKARYTIGIAYPKLLEIYHGIFTRLGYIFKIFNNIEINPKHASGKSKFNLTFSPIVIKNY